MKPIIIIIGLSLGILLGMYPGLTKPRSFLWKIAVVLIMCLSLVFTLLPPLAGTLETADRMAELRDNYEIDVEIVPDSESAVYNSSDNAWTIDIYHPDDPTNARKLYFSGSKLPEEFKSKQLLISRVVYNKEKSAYKFISTKFIEPVLVYPFIPELEERIRILNLHVPMSWIALLAYMISMINAILYLIKREPNYDIKAASSAALGLVFTILATVTGMIWAKENWGTYWNWDPRQTSIFVLMLIYAAYFALRSALENPEIKARLSSVYSILAAITAPFFIFILPRLASGLHPGSQTDNTTGPVISIKGGMLNESMLLSFSFSLGAFTIIFFWLLSILIRSQYLKNNKNLINQ